MIWAASDVEWGTVPAWVALIGALVAAIAFVSGRLDATRAQAQAVYLIVTSSHYGVGPNRSKDHTHVEVSNDSALPVYDLSIAGWQWGKRRRFWRFRKPDEWMTSERLDGRLWVVMRPQSKVTDDQMQPVKGFPPSTGRSPRDSLSPPFTLTFRDASGRRWVRWPDGKLHRRWRFK